VFVFMSLVAAMYREKAAQALQRARRTSNPSIKSAFEDVARGWVLLAEQIERMDGQKASISRPGVPRRRGF